MTMTGMVWSWERELSPQYVGGRREARSVDFEGEVDESKSFGGDGADRAEGVLVS
jgi:hypothetical protein